MRYYLVLILLILSSSCSLFNEREKKYPFGISKTYKKIDYDKHLIQIAKNFINANQRRIVSINYKDDKYLKNLVEKIYVKNENIFSAEIPIQINIIKTNEIIFFSLPGGFIFLSSELITKYLKSENIFNAIFTTEFIKSNLSLYRKNIVVPRENYEYKELIKLTRLNVEDRIVLNNLTYEVLKRTGLDAGAKLLWIQLQNRNSVDFSRSNEFNSELLREEFLMKNYMITNGDYNTEVQQNSSKDFYRFRGNIERRL